MNLSCSYCHCCCCCRHRLSFFLLSVRRIHTISIYDKANEKERAREIEREKKATQTQSIRRNRTKQENNLGCKTVTATDFKAKHLHTRIQAMLMLLPAHSFIVRAHLLIFCSNMFTDWNHQHALLIRCCRCGVFLACLRSIWAVLFYTNTRRDRFFWFSVRLFCKLFTLYLTSSAKRWINNCVYLDCGRSAPCNSNRSKAIKNSFFFLLRAHWLHADQIIWCVLNTTFSFSPRASPVSIQNSVDFSMFSNNCYFRRAICNRLDRFRFCRSCCKNNI